MRLRKLIKENLEDGKRMTKKDFLKRIAEFRVIGEELNKLANYQESMQKIGEVCQNAETVIMSEQDEWFDNVTVKKNMQELGNYYKSFEKTATEAKQIQERMLGLYEQMGFVLNRYFNMSEGAVEQPVTETFDYEGGGEGDNDDDDDGEGDAAERDAESEDDGQPDEEQEWDDFGANLEEKNKPASVKEYGGPDLPTSDVDFDDSAELGVNFDDDVPPEGEICGECGKARPGDADVKAGMPCKKCSALKEWKERYKSLGI